MGDFLTLNGWALDAADGSAEDSYQELGARPRSPSGDLGKDVTAEPLALDMATTILGPQDMAAMLGLLRGRGHRFAFDDDAYSASGLYPSATAVVSYRPDTSSTQATEVVAESTTVEYTHPKLGANCVAVERATDNLLTTNQASAETNTVGFTAYDSATLSASDEAFWVEAKSLKCICNAAGGVAGGWFTVNTVVSAETTYTCSLYLLAGSGGAADKLVTIELYDGATSTTKAVELSTTTWKRVEVTHTTGVGLTILNIVAKETTIDSGITFYADGLQIEAGACATSYWPPGDARAAGSLQYRLGCLGARDDLTIAGWFEVAPYAMLDGQTLPLWEIRYNATNYIKLTVADGGLEVTCVPSGIVFAAAQAAFSDREWHHVAVVIRRAPATGSHKAECYVDGALLASDDPASLPTLTGATLYVGCESTATYWWDGLIDELVVVPWGMTAAQIAAWYTREFSDLPFLDVGGDVVGPVEVEMLGRVGSRRRVQAYVDGAWQKCASSLPFGLDEKDPAGA